MSRVSEVVGPLPESVRAMLEEADAPTSPLGEFLAAYARDDNLWWHLPFGHQKNLFDAAISEAQDWL